MKTEVGYTGGLVCCFEGLYFPLFRTEPLKHVCDIYSGFKCIAQVHTTLLIQQGPKKQDDPPRVTQDVLQQLPVFCHLPSLV